MGLREIEDIELSENGKPVIPFDKEISFIAKGLTVIETFILAVTIGHIEAVAHAPIIYILAGITGFLHVLISWIIGFFTIGLFGGKFSWVNSLFTLLKNDQFRTGSLLLLGMFFISRILAGIFEKLSYEKRKIVSLILITVTSGNFIWLFRLIENEQEKYLFMYAVAFIPYMIIAYPTKRKKNKRR